MSPEAKNNEERVKEVIITTQLKLQRGDFPVCPVVKALCSQCRGYRFDR